MKSIGIVGLNNDIDELVQKIKSVNNFELIGVYDSNFELSQEIADKFGVTSFSDLKDLIITSDIVYFAKTFPLGCEFASIAIKNFKHLFLEKNCLSSSSQAQKLMNFAEEANIKVQISQVELFNNLIEKASQHIDNPSFIEIRRGLNIDFKKYDNKFDLNILLQDIALVSNFVKSGVRKIQASTNNSAGNKIELLNLRIEFDNKCVANISISSLCADLYHKAAFYQENKVVNIDFYKNNISVLSSEIENKETIIVNFNEQNDEKTTLISELQSFSKCIEENKRPIFGLNEAVLNLKILEEIKFNLSFNC